MPRAPHLQSIASAAPVRLDGHVVRVDLGPDAVEQDPPLAPDRAVAGRADRRRAARIAVSDSTIAPRTCDRTCSPRSATSSADGEDRLAPRPVAVRARAGRRGLAEQGRDHRPPRRGVGRHPVHHGAGQDPLVRTGVGEEGRRAGDEGLGLDAGVDDGAGVRRGVLEPHGRSPSAIRRSCGNVDSQSIARCGSSIAPPRPPAASTAAATLRRRPDRRRARPRPRRAASRQASGQVVDVRPLVLDLLRQVEQPVVRGRAASRTAAIVGRSGGRAGSRATPTG